MHGVVVIGVAAAEPVQHLHPQNVTGRGVTDSGSLRRLQLVFRGQAHRLAGVKHLVGIEQSDAMLARPPKHGSFVAGASTELVTGDVGPQNDPHSLGLRLDAKCLQVAAQLISCGPTIGHRPAQPDGMENLWRFESFGQCRQRFGITGPIFRPPPIRGCVAPFRPDLFWLPARIALDPSHVQRAEIIPKLLSRDVGEPHPVQLRRRGGKVAQSERIRTEPVLGKRLPTRTLPRLSHHLGLIAEAA
ncbi:hypothetical protein MYSI104531_27295 [Mycobacterium simiae]